MSDTADKIAKILEDPESLKMISEIAESFMAGSDNKDSGDIQEENLSVKSAVKDITDETSVASIIPKDFGSFKLIEDLLGKGDVENSIKLITALMPYMSKRRRESADSVLKWLKALKLIRKSNLSELSKLINLIQ